MPTVYVYGDSFVNEQPSFPCWPNMVAEQLGYKCVNNGVSGSSTEYSIMKWASDVNNSVFKPWDVIIFCVSSYQRLYFNHILFKQPNLASQFPNLPEGQFQEPTYAWFKENRKFIEWYYLNSNDDLNKLTHDCYVHAIKSFAELNPSITVLVFQNSNRDHFLSLDTRPANMLAPNISLGQISENEIGGISYHEFCGACGKDPRQNHFSNPNLLTLANLTVNTIRTNSDQHGWEYGKFKQGIMKSIRTLKDYQHYMKLGLVYHDDYIVRHLSK